MPPEAGPLRIAACVRATPRFVWALVVTFAGLMALYTQFVPTYHGPDEPQHVDMLFAVEEPGGWPAAVSPRTMSQPVLESAEEAEFAPGRPPRAAAEATPHRWRPTFAELEAASPDEHTDARNQMWQHPPLAYLVTATGIGALTAIAPPAVDFTHDQTVGVARLLTALALLPLPVVAYWTTRRLAPRGPAALVAAVVVVGVPGLAHLGATVTNDALLITLVGAATLPLVYIATGDLSVRTAAVTGVIGGLALLTKGFALFLPAWVVAAYVLAVWRRGPPALRRVAGSGALAMGVMTATGGWWWLRNVLELGVLQPRGSALPAAPAGFVPRAGEWASAAVAVTTRTFWGHFGWVEAQLPWPVIGVAAGILLLGFAAAFAARRHPDPWRPSDLGLLFVPVVATTTIMVYGSWSLYLESGRHVALHGRYLMPGIVGMAAAAGIGLAALPPRRWRAAWLPASLLTAAAVLHGVAFVTLLERYWMIEGTGLRDGVAALLAWSPWSRVALAAAALVTALGFAGACLELLLTSRRRPVVAPSAQPEPHDRPRERLGDMGHGADRAHKAEEVR